MKPVWCLVLVHHFKVANAIWSELRDDKHVIYFLYWFSRPPSSPCSYRTDTHRPCSISYGRVCAHVLPRSPLLIVYQSISTLVVYSVLFETASLKPHCANVVQEYRSQTSSLQRGNEFLRPSARLTYLRTWNRGRSMLILALNPGYVSVFQVSESD